MSACVALRTDHCSHADSVWRNDWTQNGRRVFCFIECRGRGLLAASSASPHQLGHLQEMCGNYLEGGLCVCLAGRS